MQGALAHRAAASKEGERREPGVDVGDAEIKHIDPRGSVRCTHVLHLEV